MVDLTFDCIGAQADRYAVMPTITLTLRISETSGQRIDTIALRTQIRIDRRGAATRPPRKSGCTTFSATPPAGPTR